MKRSGTDEAESVEARKRALIEQMHRLLAELKECPYFCLEDYLLPAAPPEVAQPRLFHSKSGPLYISRPIAAQASPARASRIQTYNPARGSDPVEGAGWE